MVVANNEKHVIAGESSDSVAGLPIKKRPRMLAQSLEPTSSQALNMPSDDRELPRKDPGDLKQVSSASNDPEEASSVITNLVDFSGDSVVKEGVNIVLKNDCDDAFGKQVDHEMAVINDKRIGNLSFLMLDNHCRSTQVTGSIDSVSAGSERVVTGGERSSMGELDETDVPKSSGASGNLEVQSAMAGLCKLFKDQESWKITLVKQEKLDSCAEDVAWNEKLGTHSSCVKAESRVNRFNWDLNTPMYTWEGSCEDQGTSTGTIGLDDSGSDKGDILKKNLDAVPELLRPSQANETNSILERLMLTENEVQLKLSNVSMLVNKHHKAEDCLDLQLKQSFISESCINQGSRYASDLNPGDGVPFQDLSMKHTLSFLDPRLPTCRDVKPEPYEDCSGNDFQKVAIGTQMLGGFGNIKLEACERKVQESPKPTTSTGPMSSRTDVKPEQSEDVAQQCPGHLKGMLFDKEPEIPLKPQGEGVEPSNLKLGLVSASPNRESSKLSNLPDLPCDSNNSGERVDNAVGFASEVPIHGKDELQLGCQMPMASSIDRNRRNYVGNSFSLFSRDLSGVSPELKSTKSTQSELSHGRGDKGADGMTRVTGQADLLDGCTGKLLEVDSASEPHKGSYKTGKVAADANLGDIGESGEIMQRICGHALNGSDDVDDLVDATSRQDEHNHDLHGPAVSLSGVGLQGMSLGTMDADSERPDGVGISMPSADQEAIRVENLNDAKNEHHTADSDDHFYSEKNEPGNCAKKLLESSDAQPAAACLGKKRLPMAKHKMPQDHLKVDKGLEKKASLGREIGGKAVIKSKIKSKCEVGSQWKSVKLSQSPLEKLSNSPKREFPEKSDALEHFTGKHNLIQIKDPGPASKKMKPVSGKLISSETKCEMPMEVPSRRQGPYYQGSREESLKGRYQKLESKRNLDHYTGKHGSDMMRNRRGADRRLDVLSGAMDIVPIAEKVNCSTGFRFPNSVNASDKALGDGGWMARNLADDELQQLPRVPYRRWSPPVRGQKPVDVKMVNRRTRGVSPNRHIGRDFDFVSHEEDFMRSLPGNCVDHVMMPRSHKQYGHISGAIMHTERRSPSPILQRDHAFSPQFYSRSSRRSLDRFQGHPELVSSRSPPINRLDRMISPRESPCVAEDMLIRRHGRLVEHLPSDLIDAGPSRERELPRLVKCGQRIIRRRDLDSQDIADVEFAEPVVRGKFRELAEDDHIELRRELDERRGYSLKQHQNYVENCREVFHFPVDDGHPRPFGVCHEADDEFPVGMSVEHDGHIRNWPGNTNRGRCIEEEERYRHPRQQGWHNGGFNADRLKRRRS